MPLVVVRDGRVIGVEALVRWQNDGRLLPPNAFLPEVIRGGQMADLTRLMLHRSLHEIKGLPISVPVTINVPPELMTDWILTEAARAIAAARISWAG